MEIEKQDFLDNILETMDEQEQLKYNKKYNELTKDVKEKEKGLRSILKNKDFKQMENFLDSQFELHNFANRFYYEFGIKTNEMFNFIKQYDLN